MYFGVFVLCRFRVLLLVIYMIAVADRSPRLGKKEHFFLLSLTYVVYEVRGLIFLLVLGMGCVILLCHSLGLPYNYVALVT